MFYFTPLQGFFFTFPSRYYFTIGHPGVFSLTRWSSLIHTGFHVSHATRDKLVWFAFDYGTFTIYGAGFSCFVYQIFLLYLILHEVQNQINHVLPRPLNLKFKFRLFPLRSPLLRESRLLSFPPATKMFQFTGLPLPDLWIQSGVLKVALFGNLRIIACFQLPEAFRWFPRPSSSLDA